MAMVIPAAFARARGIEVGIVLGLLKIRIVRKRRRNTLSELVAKYKTSHRHKEWELGAPLGKETW